MTNRQAPVIALQQELAVVIEREITGIAGIAAAVPRVPPDYVSMFHAVKMAKQANVEQMTTLVRLQRGSPDERGGIGRALTRVRVEMTSRLSLARTLRAMRRAEVELVTLYAAAVTRADGLAKRGLRKALGRALIHVHLLTAHLAKRTGSKGEASLLASPLGDQFAGDSARACMRCHLDRPGVADPLERTDPHPYTYVCAGCHDEVLGEFAPDLAAQIDRWPRAVREARVMQHALGRVSKLNAIGQVLHPLAGLEPELPTPAAERAVLVPAMTPTPGPAPGERPVAPVVEIVEGLEGAYVSDLFSASRMWRHW